MRSSMMNGLLNHLLNYFVHFVHGGTSSTHPILFPSHLPSKNNWIDQGLVKEYTRRGLVPPFDVDTIGNDALNLDTHQRITILADLCEWLLRSSDTLRSLVPDYGTVLRLEPVGDMVFDGALYYVMEDARLYSHSNGKGDDFWDSEWNVIAVSNEQYETFFNDLQSKIATLKGKQRKNAQALLDSVQTEYDEWIQEALKEQERRIRRNIRRRDGSPSKLRDGGMYNSYYPEGVTKRSGRLAEREAKMRSEREARILEERQREAERLNLLRERQSQRIPISSDNTGDLGISDRERRRLLRTEKRIIEEEKEIEIAAIEAKYLRQTGEEDERTFGNNLLVENETNYEGPPRIKIVLKAKPPEKVEQVDEPGPIDSVEDIGAIDALSSPQELHHASPLPNESKSEKPPTPPLMGDARLLVEFAKELQSPVVLQREENTGQSSHFDTGQDETTGT